MFIFSEVDDADLKAPEVDLDEHHPKATRTLFIGNLEKEITIEELKEKLKSYGEILVSFFWRSVEEIRRVSDDKSRIIFVSSP